MKITLSIIAKDEVEKLANIFVKYAKYFDEIVVAYDDTVIFEKLKERCPDFVKFFKYEWNEWEKDNNRINFSRKRKFIATKVTGDYYFRMDTDDDILHPENIIKLAQDAFDRELAIVYCWYIYSKDADGNINADHYRETIIKSHYQNMYWNKKIHENILPKSQAGFNTHVDYDNVVVIEHNPDEDHAEKSLLRNMEYLIDEYNEDKENTDPRTIAYLGRTYMALEDFDKAKFFLQKHIDKSGWDEDRYISWCYLAEIFKKEENFLQAIACCNEAMLEMPEWPDSYLKLHDILFQQGQWEKAIEFGKIGLSKPSPKTMMLRDPSSYTWRPAISMAFSYLQIDEVEKAHKLFMKSKQLAPNLPWIKENENIFVTALEHKNFMKHFLYIFQYVKERSSEDAVKMLQLVPDEVAENEFIIDMKKAFLPKKVWSDKSIVIFCPKTPESWSPKSLETGIGGSEEAVIRMSEQLTNLGYEVTVYNTCDDDEGLYNGVNYINQYKFNKKDDFNILISWRTNLCHHGIYGKYNFVWIHDMPDHSILGEDSIKKVDKIIVLSNYHRSLLPEHIKDEKVFVSSNGIVPEDFQGIEVHRNPHRMIWASSYDRGLETILQNWGEIRKAVPDAEIHIYYGWNTYDNYMKMGLFTSDFKDRMLKLFKQEGVQEHGRIGHMLLLEEYSKSGVWAYPCKYAGEINCIALTKAVACGCKVITNEFAVMKERSPNAIPDKYFIQAVITALLDGNPIELARKFSATLLGYGNEITLNYSVNIADYIRENSWLTIAASWSTEFKSLFPCIIKDRSQWIKSVIPDNGLSIVDIGSNKGHIFKGYNRDHITSVDIDEYDIPNFVRADAQSLPFEDDQFDTALLAEILEHVPDDIKALQEAKRVSKRLVVSVPYEHEWASFLKPFNKVDDEMREKGKTKMELALEGNATAKDFHMDDDLNHLWHCRYYTPQTLIETFKKAGFTDFDVKILRNEEWSWIGAIVYE